VREQLFEIANSLKAYQGEYTGLQDSSLLGQKIRWERELRNRINANPALKAKYGDVWDQIAALQPRKIQVSTRLNLTNAEWLGAPQLASAYEIARYLQYRNTPDAQRPEDLRGENWQRLEQTVQNPEAPDPMIASALLTAQLQMIARWMPSTDPLRARFIHAGETPEQAATRLANSTHIMDAAFRQKLLNGSYTALQSSQDPAVQLALAMLNGRDQLQTQWDQLKATEAVQQARLAQAGFAAFGTNIPPDATFTLRISDGVVKGYPYNGTRAPAFTTFYGIFDRSSDFNNEMPFTLPAQYEANRAGINMATPLDFVTTNDITGGNSGSPIIDRDGRIVGLAFDGNIESLPNEFLYRNELARCVGVSSAGITEALRNIYHADALLRELTGTK